MEASWAHKWVDNKVGAEGQAVAGNAQIKLETFSGVCRNSWLFIVSLSLVNVKRG